VKKALYTEIAEGQPQHKGNGIATMGSKARMATRLPQPSRIYMMSTWLTKRSQCCVRRGEVGGQIIRM
jgi:hypothetical protein